MPLARFVPGKIQQPHQSKIAATACLERAFWDINYYLVSH
jgi:hypothetical protein